MSTLYYYSDLNGKCGWFESAAAFRKSFPDAKLAIRTAHVGILTPKGYHKPDGELASHGIKKQAQ